MSAEARIRVIQTGGAFGTIMGADKIIFSGVGKDKYEIETAIKNKILQFNIESEEELYDIYEVASKLKITANICLRINPDIAPNTHKKISTGEKETKFGIDNEHVFSIYEKLHKLKFINPVGLGVHIGSQIFDFNFLFLAEFKKFFSNFYNFFNFFMINTVTNDLKKTNLDTSFLNLFNDLQRFFGTQIFVNQ